MALLSMSIWTPEVVIPSAFTLVNVCLIPILRYFVRSEIKSALTDFKEQTKLDARLTTLELQVRWLSDKITTDHNAD